MTDSTSAAGATLLDPGVAVFNDTELTRRGAYSCSDLDQLVDDDIIDEEDDDGPAEGPSASDDSNMVTMVLMTLLFAGFLAVCGFLVVQMMRADEAAFVRRLEQRTTSRWTAPCRAVRLANSIFYGS